MREALRINVCVVSGVFMTGWTVVSAGHLTSSQIGSFRHGLKVDDVDAQAIPAFMVQLQLNRNRAICQLVDAAMRHVVEALFAAPPVSVLVDPARPL